MSNILFKYIAVILIFLFCVISVFIVFYVNKKFSVNKNRKNFLFLNMLESFACGIFMSIGIIHILPEALSTNKIIKINGINFTPTLLLIVFTLSFIFFLFSDHLPNFISHKKNHKNSSITLIFSWLSLLIHSFFTGLSLGIMNGKFIIVFIFFLGIITHKFFVVFSLTTHLLKNKNFSKQIVFIFMIIFSLSTPLGIIMGNIININDSSIVISLFLVISAGTLFYVGTLHGLGESVLIRKCCHWENFICMFVGFAIMSGLAII